MEKDAEIESLKDRLTKSGITDKTVQSEIFKMLRQLENEVRATCFRFLFLLAVLSLLLLLFFY